MKKIIPLIFCFISVFCGAILILLLSKAPSYGSIYKRLSLTEQARMIQRNQTQNLQNKAINKKMMVCLYDSSGIDSAIDDNGAIANEVYYFENHGKNLFSNPNSEQVNQLVNQAEQQCTTSILDSVAIGNPNGARALAALLQEKNYSLNEDYQKAAKKDDVALTQVHF